MEQFSHLGDEALQTLVTEGNTEAEEALIKRFSHLVRRSARPFFLAGGDSEDLTQEGMMGLLSAVRTFCPDQGTSFQTYAETCIRNRLLTALKSATRHKHTPLNDAVSLESPQFEESQTRPAALPRDMEERLLEKEGADEMWGRLEKLLSGFEQQVLRLFLAGLSYQEMARQVERPVKSVDNAVQRIRKKLAQQL